MTCTEALDLMLDADPELLAGTGDAPFTDHLRSCSSCRTAAARVLAAYAQDRADYLGVTSHREPAAIVARAVAAPRPTNAAPIRRRTVPRVAIGLIPLAAAAAVMLVISARRNARHEAFQASIDAAFAAATPVTNVKVPPGRNAIVFKTRDPNISVVWLY